MLLSAMLGMPPPWALASSLMPTAANELCYNPSNKILEGAWDPHPQFHKPTSNNEARRVADSQVMECPLGPLDPVP